MSIRRLPIFLVYILLSFAAELSGQDLNRRVRELPLPDSAECARAATHKLKVTLRFGYLADNREASSLRSRTEHNRAGFPERVYEFGDDGIITAKHRYSYENSGQRLRELVSEQFRAGELISTSTAKYDAGERLVDFRFRSAGEREFRVAFTYDPQGQLLSRQDFEPDGLPGGVTVHAYDPAGRRTETIDFAIGSVVKRRIRYTYSPEGRLEQETHFLHSNTLLFTLDYAYDPAGRKIEAFRRGRKGNLLGEETWRYDAAGREVEHTVLGPGEIQPMRMVTYYDPAGQKVEYQTFDNDGSIFQWFQYDYDSTGTGAGYRRLYPDGRLDAQLRERYDAQGRITEYHLTFTDASSDQHITYRYDDTGLPMEEKHRSLGQEAAVYWFVFERY
ncbi:MAG: hypothetical protein AAF998_03420 [Bacteroidota bacterium]